MDEIKMKPKDSTSIKARVKNYLLSQTEFKTPLEICEAIGEDRSRMGTIMSRYRDLICEGYLQYDAWVTRAGHDDLIKAYRLAKPLFTNGLLFEESRV
jgi:hypothetical protein